ncbi:hypothetical protein BC829DRAFT_417272 [Chytridium lagenaria]|nr:hypothetical protein BC829DRAFT_417272 [Chytridium lagenaria]
MADIDRGKQRALQAKSETKAPERIVRNRRMKEGLWRKPVEGTNLYVGGLEWFGKVVEGFIMTEKGSKKSDGFGFVTYKSMLNYKRFFDMWYSFMDEGNASPSSDEGDLADFALNLSLV